MRDPEWDVPGGKPTPDEVEIERLRAENAALRRMLKEELVHQDQSEYGDGKYLAWNSDGSALLGRFETFDAAIDAAGKAMQEGKP